MIGLFRRKFRKDESLGARGETLAESYLKKRNYKIIDRNLHVGKDEADIVAVDPDGKTIVIVEVKTRRDGNILPEEHVSLKKQYNLSRLAGKLSQKRDYENRPFRFDVVSIIWQEDTQPEVTHYVGAFDSQL